MPMSEDQNAPPSRDGLSESQVWEWAGDHWRSARSHSSRSRMPAAARSPQTEPTEVSCGVLESAVCLCLSAPA